MKPAYTTAAATAAKSLQSCPTLCDPIDGSLPGSSVPGILQARTLECPQVISGTVCFHPCEPKGCTGVLPAEEERSPPNPVLNLPHGSPVPNSTKPQLLPRTIRPQCPGSADLSWLCWPPPSGLSSIQPHGPSPIPPISEPLHRLFPLPGNSL